MSRIVSIWSAEFWKAASERAIKTFAQTEASLLLASGTGLLDTDWVTGLSVSGMAAVVSLLTSVGSGYVTKSGPSLTNETLED